MVDRDINYNAIKHTSEQDKNDFEEYSQKKLGQYKNKAEDFSSMDLIKFKRKKENKTAHLNTNESINQKARVPKLPTPSSNH